MSNQRQYSIDVERAVFSDTDRKRFRAIVYAGHYLEKIGLSNVPWEVLKWGHTWPWTRIDALFFRGANADKSEFIFELKGGIERLNNFLQDCYLDELRAGDV